MAGAALLVALAALGWRAVNRTEPNPPPAPATTEQPAAAIPAEGPRLVIEVDGEAKGTVVIALAADVAPNHAERLCTLAEAGAYDGVVFHRVIDGFMAQTGDVAFGREGGDLSRAGTGGSDLPDLAAEFSSIPFERGVVGMARARHPDSANSQFFVMFAPGPHLNGQYTVVGRVIEGMEVVDAIKRGEGRNGKVFGRPDVMRQVRCLR
ncbi:peptidylprolyl isomerase [Meinhardsimonia xiamenensis]|jgi:peptidylprolyl isomerase|uniref:Peptidyl-prolyl cis-trans isomerase n=2 Tax=Meinhardsimonia xiamenensis TaxID=990712 RepID=A0A1G9FEV9_9RHOB|nr:peptidylprolyl isomerase [Meinhardsimonia xiamenensis]PRX37876.1 peptidylprolyl isomerase [Meinhardsimonia xiamenensis]SDK86918.1 peptidylprolyl isomerase [Meinhardsimonia xiamenensis]